MTTPDTATDFCGGPGSGRPGPCPKGEHNVHHVARANANAAHHARGQMEKRLRAAEGRHKILGTEASGKKVEEYRAAHRDAHAKAEKLEAEAKKHEAAAASRSAPQKPAVGKTSAPQRPASGGVASQGLPSDADLEKAKVEPLSVAGAVHGSGGLSKVTVGGRPHFFKTATPSEAAREEATASLAKIAGVNVPASRQATVGGKAGVLSSWSDGESGEKNKASFEAAVKADPEGATRHALFNFLVGAEDRHSGNYLVGKDGKVASIDHSDSVPARRSPTDAAELMGQDSMLAAMEKAQGGGDIKFHPKAVQAMAGAAVAMADRLRASGMADAAKSLEARGAALQKLAKEKNPTEGRLKEIAGTTSATASLERKSNSAAAAPATLTPPQSQAVKTVQSALSNPNTKAFLAKNPTFGPIANAVATDYMRKMAPAEREAVADYLKKEHPQLAERIEREYPQHWPGASTKKATAPAGADRDAAALTKIGNDFKAGKASYPDVIGHMAGLHDKPKEHVLAVAKAVTGRDFPNKDAALRAVHNQVMGKTGEYAETHTFEEADEYDEAMAVYCDGGGVIRSFCGGPGSGKPGPCPKDRPEVVAHHTAVAHEKLAMSLKGRLDRAEAEHAAKGTAATARRVENLKHHHVDVSRQAAIHRQKADQLRASAAKQAAWEASPEGQAWSKEARRSGVNPKDLHSLAKVIQSQDSGEDSRHQALKRSAEAKARSLGTSLQTLRARTSGRHVDSAAVRHLDDIAASMAREEPEWFHGHQDKTGRLFDLLTADRSRADRGKSYRQALDILVRMKQQKKQSLEQDVPFGEEDEAVRNNGGVVMGEAVDSPPEKKADPTPATAADRHAPAGADGPAAARLLQSSVAHGGSALRQVVSDAVRRTVDKAGPEGLITTGRLFTDEERQRLADAIAATRATAELLGRVRIRLRAKQLSGSGSVAKHSEDVEQFCMEGENRGKPGPCPGPGQDKPVDSGDKAASGRRESTSVPGQPASRHRPAPPSAADLAAAPKTSLSGMDVQKVTVGGRDYVIKSKLRDSNVESKRGAQVEQAVSELASIAGVNSPAVWSMKVGNNESTVGEFVTGQSLDKVPPGEVRSVLAKVPPGQIDRQILFDYAVGFHDIHNGNYMIDQGGNLVGIDKEFSIGRNSSPGVTWRPPLFVKDLPGEGQSYRDIPLAKSEVDHMVSAAGKMVQALRSSGRPAEADYVARRAAVLGKLADSERPMLGDLEKLSSTSHLDQAGSPAGVAARLASWAKGAIGW